MFENKYIWSQWMDSGYYGWRNVDNNHASIMFGLNFVSSIPNNTIFYNYCYQITLQSKTSYDQTIIHTHIIMK